MPVKHVPDKISDPFTIIFETEIFQWIERNVELDSEILSWIVCPTDPKAFLIRSVPDPRQILISMSKQNSFFRSWKVSYVQTVSHCCKRYLNVINFTYFNKKR